MFIANSLRLSHDSINKIKELICRNHLLKKHNPYTNVFVIGSHRNSLRFVFQTYPHPEYGNVLILTRTFFVSDHESYERCLATCTPINYLDENQYQLYEISNNQQAHEPQPEPQEQQHKQNLNNNDKEYVFYRDQIIQLTDQQEATTTKLCQDNNKNAIILGGAGAGKTLLAEKYLITVAKQQPEKQLLYIAPSVLLAAQMRSVMHAAKINNVACLGLTEIATADSQFNNYKIFRNVDLSKKISFKQEEELYDEYISICQRAALQATNTHDGKIFETVKKYTTLLNSYTEYLTSLHKTDLNLGLGFPYGLVRNSDIIVFDEYQQIAAPLLVKIKESSRQLLLFGDPNQTIETTNLIVLHNIQTIMKIEKVYLLESTHRVSLTVQALADKLLELKNQKFPVKNMTTPRKSQQSTMGKSFIIDKKKVKQSFFLPITTAVLCLTEIDYQHARNFFNAANIYRIKEILGFEFETVIVYVPKNLLSYLDQQQTKSSITECAEIITVFNQLYVAFTRTKTNILLLCDNSANFCKEINVASLEMITELPATINSYFSQQPLRHEAIAIIRHEAEAGYLTKAEKLYREFISNNDNFLIFCSAHNINCCFHGNEAVYKKAEQEYIKTLLFSRYLPSRDFNLVINHLIIQLTTDTIDEERTAYTCHLLGTYIENAKNTAILPQELYPALCHIIKHTSNTRTKKNAMYTLEIALHKNSTRPTNHNCIVQVYPTLCDLLRNTEDLSTKMLVVSTLLACLSYTRIPPIEYDCIASIYPSLCDLLLNTSNKKNQVNVAVALARCVDNSTARPENYNCIEKIYPTLCQLLAEAKTVKIQTSLTHALHIFLTKTTARPSQNEQHYIQNIFPILCNFMCLKSESLTYNCIQTLLTCINNVEVSSTISEHINNLYPALCDLIQTTPTTTPNYNLLNLLNQCLQNAYTSPKDSDFNYIAKTYPKLCDILISASSEPIKTAVLTTLTRCLKTTIKKPENVTCIQKLYPYICQLIQTTNTKPLSYKASALLDICLQNSSIKPINESIKYIRSLYPTLCEMLNNAPNESTKIIALSTLTECLKITKTTQKDDDCIQDSYPGICQLIGTATSERIKFYCIAMFLELINKISIKPKDRNCIMHIYPALCELLTKASSEKVMHFALEAFKICLTKSFIPNDKDCLEKLQLTLRKQAEETQDQQVREMLQIILNSLTTANTTS
jgi:hypothetical protein